MADWTQFPQIAEHREATHWLRIQEQLGLAPNTVLAYARALEDYFEVCRSYGMESQGATRAQIAMFIQEMHTRKLPDGRLGLANATIHQRLTGVRLYYDYLIEEGLQERNPVGRGSYVAGRIDMVQRGIVPRQKRLPWIPNDEQWHDFLKVARGETIRNRTMLAFAYDAALRREELCALQTQDIDPARRLLRIRAETTKNGQERIVPYSAAADELYQSYLGHRRSLSRMRGPLFLSESRRNRTQPITIWTWSKVVQALAERANLRQVTTHTFRHLCLTDLAHAGWDVHEIARFAGHRSIQSTLTYIHLSSHDLATKVAQGMNEIHAWRLAQLMEAWQ